MIELDKDSFKKLIDEDIKGIHNCAVPGLEKIHIVQILQQTPDLFYQPLNKVDSLCACTYDRDHGYSMFWKFCPLCGKPIEKSNLN